MAIFSQMNSSTEIDFRKYDSNNENRNVPFLIPNEIKTKLIQLMKCLQLDTGSIDLAVNNNNEFIFFEINPVGQFAMVSDPCNYNLHKLIADYLTI